MVLSVNLFSAISAVRVWGLAVGVYVVHTADSCITQHEAQGPSRTCNESNEEEKRECTSCTLRMVVAMYWRMRDMPPSEEGLSRLFKLSSLRGLGSSTSASVDCWFATLETTQGQIVSQSPTDATQFW